MLAGNIVNCDIFILRLFEDDRCDSGHLYVVWGVKGWKKKDNKKHKVGIRKHFWRGKKWRGSEMLIEKRRKSIKVAALIDSILRCFLWRCREEHSSSFCLPLSSSSISCHLGSSCCRRLLLYVSRYSPRISLFYPLFLPPPCPQPIGGCSMPLV